jgi:hypothetical protein
VLPETSRGDQRAKDRYPIMLELQYKLLDRGRVERVGVGRTVNISSNGVLFETDRSLPPGGSVELAMKWPFLLRGICGMKLVVRGRIVRRHADTTATAVRVESHEFRTAGFRVARDESSMVQRAANPWLVRDANLFESSASRLATQAEGRSSRAASTSVSLTG